MTLKTYDVELQIDKQIAELNRDAKGHQANGFWLEASASYGGILALLDLKAWVQEFERQLELGVSNAKGKH